MKKPAKTKQARPTKRDLFSGLSEGTRLGSRIAARFVKIGLTSDLPELHGKRSQELPPNP